MVGRSWCVIIAYDQQEAEIALVTMAQWLRMVDGESWPRLVLTKSRSWFCDFFVCFTPDMKAWICSVGMNIFERVSSNSFSPLR